jgi:ribosomal protein L11 methylase PrmA
VDTDDLAVKTAFTNGVQNKVDDLFTVWQGELRSVSEKSWDVVLVNILAPVIIGLLLENHLLDYVAASGWLVLSGIIDSQVADVEAALSAVGGRIVERLVVRDWVTLVVQHS